MPMPSVKYPRLNFPGILLDRSSPTPGRLDLRHHQPCIRIDTNQHTLKIN